MSKTLRSLRRAVKAGVEAASQPIPEHAKYRIGDRPVRCSQCGGDTFEQAPPFTDMFVGPAIQCVRCSHLEIFGKRVLIEVVA
jgi:DNA-directed RNA polymerase subunit RPC12/RpoP